MHRVCITNPFSHLYPLIRNTAQNLIEVIDYGRETADHHYGHKIQAFHRFFVDSMSSEGNAFPYNPWLLPPPSGVNDPAAAPVTQLFGVDSRNIITCTNCKAVREKEHMTHVVELAYPRKVTVNCSQIGSRGVLTFCRLPRTTQRRRQTSPRSYEILSCDSRRTGPPAQHAIDNLRLSSRRGRSLRNSCLLYLHSTPRHFPMMA